MARTARARGARVRPAAAPVLPEDLVVSEILVRLPTKTLLRCRAVCRSWRRLTSAAVFLLAHHRHQPSLPLVCFRGRNPECDHVDDALDIRRSPVERRPVLRFNDYKCRVHASCDGLLVVSLNHCRYYYICNPTTRQSILLPNLRSSCVLGLYPHGSSGEYRILYRNGRQCDDNAPCYVLTVGSSSMAPRHGGKYRSSGMHDVQKIDPPVLAHGCLHWLHSYGGKVLVFDTVGESFRWMSAPTYDTIWTESRLEQINGTLGISRMNRSRTMIKLWMLQNCEADDWLMKYQIKIPVAEMTSIANSPYLNRMVLSENGDVLVYCERNSNLFHCDSTGKLLQKFQSDDLRWWPTREWFKESLVQHAFFQRKDGRRARKPHFFRGL